MVQSPFAEWGPYAVCRGRLTHNGCMRHSSGASVGITDGLGLRPREVGVGGTSPSPPCRYAARRVCLCRYSLEDGIDEGHGSNG